MLIRAEKLAMAEKEFAMQRQLSLLAAKKRAAAAPAPAPASEETAAGPPRAFVLMVEESDLVPIKQKLQILTPSLSDLEQCIRRELKLDVDVTVWAGGNPIGKLDQLQSKCKVSVRQRVASKVASSEAPGVTTFKLMVSENEVVKMKCKVKVPASSMHELEVALAAKLQIPNTFSICPFDKDFGEYVEGVQFADMPPVAEVQLRTKTEETAVTREVKMAESAPAPPAIEALQVPTSPHATL